MPEVRLVGLGKRYGKVVAVNDVNLTVNDGEYVTILGPSGCGKTTLIRMIAGIIEPTKGKVFISGRDMTGVPIEDRDIGYVFQNIALFPHLTVRDNVSYGPRARDLPPEEQSAVCRRFLEMVRLLDKMSMFPSELCGGEQQKVSLARALSSGSKLLLLDEPLSALDSRVRVDLRYELRRLSKELGITTVHVTHDQEEAQSVSDRIVLMRAGALMETGTPEQLYTRPKNIFTANFIGETNLLEGWVREVQGVMSTIELRNGGMVRVAQADLEVGDAAVISVRPEFMFPAREGMKARVGDITYMGTYWRITASTEDEEEVCFDTPTLDGNPLTIGKELYLAVNPKAAVLYPRPEDGIEEAIKLE
ncbi:MAG: ABC transporter ATP-binding protein [Methanomassiliicoccales archaeon]|nr:ABC transporter ATP-binding protein [Methanomassiliicoccales archaeon]